ncbi:helix-turn-helix domain-containing protein [uncultured Ruminococcus sp.]|uniref:helix-turn-helix domain-containing protein n=1 Tax=uncultured Ruminococcus sp. TaxID=165186 RepID=UPI001563A9F9|nr:helix-turn-helix transcriptional regulator [uncultured Ruminococcus sp.]
MPNVDLIAIGKRIQNQRLALGYTQQFVYEKLDISQNHYSRIENGHVGMSFEILLQISEVLRISTDYILSGNIRSDDNIELINNYKALTPKQRQYINDHLKLFIDAELK